MTSLIPLVYHHWPIMTHPSGVATVCPNNINNTPTIPFLTVLLCCHLFFISTVPRGRHIFVTNATTNTRAVFRPRRQSYPTVRAGLFLCSWKVRILMSVFCIFCEGLWECIFLFPGYAYPNRLLVMHDRPSLYSFLILYAWVGVRVEVLYTLAIDYLRWCFLFRYFQNITFITSVGGGGRPPGPPPPPTHTHTHTHTTLLLLLKIFNLVPLALILNIARPLGIYR